jgi:hypothetical protein
VALHEVACEEKKIKKIILIFIFFSLAGDLAECRRAACAQQEIF